MNKARIRAGRRYAGKPKTISLRETINFLSSIIIIMFFLYFTIITAVEILRQAEIIINIPLNKSCGV